MGQTAVGAAKLEDAVWRGTACPNDEAVVASTLSLVYCVGVRQARHAEAERWARHNDAALTRLGGDRELDEPLRCGESEVLPGAHATGD